jgi:hypothetical protein
MTWLVLAAAFAVLANGLGLHLQAMDMGKRYVDATSMRVELKRDSQVQLYYHDFSKGKLLAGKFNLPKGVHNIQLGKKGFYSLKSSVLTSQVKNKEWQKLRLAELIHRVKNKEKERAVIATYPY